ncbi:hypothetical protein [Sporomusa malonica]|uniref:Uncharacterized protein n=1 Tax=Sporomusa malonica TaxID=112901 RepID=A0A1W2EJS5_9FIRM|nr:hypothetical protein [Sporomusa malonica]SMD09408.1 hypothetical protein SAMN04488500_12481 [Sporomusa malonica]
MQENFKVAVQRNNQCGYIEYDQASKTVKVVFDDAETRQIIEAYLAAEHVIRVAGEGLLDFKDVTIRPAASVDNLKTALTRIWGKTGVHVDWSRPVA